ncbi:MAG: putative molybdopterin binding domain protein [Clostridiales bacterium]|jgi:molybdenum cofactor synthesis domain-containing protein|nr:putative molybdopterin binding domain protein [Clostridiales bacterium]
MKIVKVEDAVGVALCHDITKIVPGEFKGVAFKKGHIIREEDIPELLSIGKRHIYIWEDREGILHENEAAERLKALVGGEGLYFGEIKEGKIEFYAAIDGLLKIDSSVVFDLNLIEDIILSTVHNNTVVKKGDKVAATKVVPLFIEEDKIKGAEETVKKKIINIVPIMKKRTAIITTGSEVYSGRIKDSFGPVLKNKLGEYGCEVLGQSILSDDPGKVEESIKEWLDKGAEMILVTGGMSVDPDDLTPSGIKNSGAEIITYGTPVLPGAMLLMAYKGSVPIIGLPGAVIFSKRTAFDLILPRVLTGEKLQKRDFAALGHGGLCISCEDCTFPRCGFGRG